ncbi:TetR family transcriptional regulator [Streptomyces sp. NPDC007084]|uniref:TetR family transcriptional regulator n=1 Tax=Streptomyces sp. NPDC007084 TaxID=3154313 RepID=UPI0034560520
MRETDWERVVLLHEALGRVAPSPAVELNRAVAVVMASGPLPALDVLDDLAASGRLTGFYPLPSAGVIPGPAGMAHTLGMQPDRLPTRHPAPTPPPPDPPRVAWRKAMRERVLEEAWRLAAREGWDRVRVGDLAVRAEVSRPSIYAEFGDRAGIGAALVERESGRFLLGVAEVLDAHRHDVAAALEAGVAHALAESARNPFVRAVIAAAQGGTDALLPFLSSRPEPVFSQARELVDAWLAEVAPGVLAKRRLEATDLIVRLTVSHMLLPSPDAGASPARVARAACAVLVTNA